MDVGAREVWTTASISCGHALRSLLLERELMGDLNIVSMRGGMNDEDASPALMDDQCTNALDIEWFYSYVGERRAGCDPLDVTSPFAGQDAVVHLSQWFPTSDITNPELFGIGAKPGKAGTTPVFFRRIGTATGTPLWTQVTPIDAATPIVPDIYEAQTQAVNSKLFWAYNTPNNFTPNIVSGFNNGYNRFHVWDGSGLRRTGIFQASATASLANEGSGNFSSTRYYRVRYIRQDSNGKVIRRSEPSGSISISPSGTGAGITVTRGSALSDGETHWELEASFDNANFFRIATLPMSQTTVNDENASGYTGAGTPNFPLSEAIGAYLLQPAFRFVAADDDRLLGAGSWVDPTLASTVYWSPRLNDPGVGNDERQPIVDTGGTAITTSLNLDPADGGAITGITNAINGSWYVFKQGMIFKMNRTLDVTKAYEAQVLSNKRGAVKGSVFQGMDNDGRPVVYFLDPVLGPSLINSAGIHRIRGLRTTWKRVNLKAANIIARGVFYPYKQQAKWWVAVDGNDSPTLGMTLQVSELQSHPNGGYHRGWSLFDGRIAQALTATLYNEWVLENGSANLSSRPFIGLTSPDFVQRCDVDSTDAGQTYSAKLVTKPFPTKAITDRWGVLNGTLAADANAAATVQIRLIRDLGVETTAAIAVNFAPVGSETIVIPDIDNLALSDGKLIQLQISDS